ncbi:sigma-70 family RNA polymerase sigma factor [Paenibacillus sp. HN-1]|uniref:sigma-70 family RNA polymerase sigma factor n=1 Tax=Paenibacillus TaxID=44249 RepID=UPI001CAA0933|nr:MULTISPECIES: sigma-70 family RNA polymerase sigma factor [Paenibacillus]MBY9081070.1 sigma-70 family RNA polymerase sigma factor [Paenibacillus sp. CGMCC 1.18879]MBY9087107.1 sigma-70 family RNA polymerase sigma factor [Paenibacillus sinensis]
MNEEELSGWLQKLREGDSQAFIQVHEFIKRPVYGTVCLLVKTRNDAADVTNEIYMELFRSLPKYDESKPFKAWLNGIIVRQCSNYNRKQWRKSRVEGRVRDYTEGTVSPGADQLAVNRERREELLHLVTQLPYKFRSVIVLRYFQECSFEEIGVALGIPVGTAKSRHFKALGKLRKLAGADGLSTMKEEWQWVSKMN